MKNFKDYAHLYIGCQMVSNTTGRHGKLLQVRVDDTDYEAKPILRPLSDMTQEEAKHIIDFFGKEVTVKGWKSNYETTCLNHNPEFTRWLLSLGFDIFGLIKAGIALDKTTIKNG